MIIIRKGANYGYSLREGPQAMTARRHAAGPGRRHDPVQITDTIVRGTVKPIYPVIAYPHTAIGGDAIAGGFIYRGTGSPHSRASSCSATSRPATSGTRTWTMCCRADDGNPATLATMHEVDAGLRASRRRDIPRARRPR